MAPMTTRSTRPTSFPNELSNGQAVIPHNYREESWQLEGVRSPALLVSLRFWRLSDLSQDDSRSEREPSENPSGSFQDYDGDFEYDSIRKPWKHFVT